MKIKILPKYLIPVLVLILGCGEEDVQQTQMSVALYVDSKNGDDRNSGKINDPFASLDKALKVVRNRVNQGIRSDKIYLREGRYKKISPTTLYQLELKGTQDDWAELSAMPCEKGTPGCVERKSGKWYENVVFDDGFIIDNPWEKVDGNIWKTNPGFTKLEWTHQNLWPWTRTKKGFPLTRNDSTPETTSFTVAPYMLLQDGEPTFWKQYLDSLTGPGMRTYNHETGELFVWPLNGKNPNTCKWESWYGGPEPYEVGTLHLDGEGRALFDGNLEFVAIRGFEFYAFNKLFELHRRKYHKEEDRVIQHNVLLEDNLFRYGWIQILLDGNTVWDTEEEGLILPRYHDRYAWTARNNVYYRPSRECFQLHGDNHIFEYNSIIEHNGPWAGPAACVSAVNTRNTRNAMIRNNYILRHGKTKWHKGSVFMIEVHADPTHSTGSGDYKLGGQTYENNLFEDIEGAAFVLGKGGLRMQNITLRGNIFKTGRDGQTIRLSSAHKNLVIDNNIFYDQQEVIGLYPGRDKSAAYDSVLSAISIRNNMFVANEQTIDPKLLSPASGSRLYIENNLFYKNDQDPVGRNAINRDPDLRSPENLDFRSAKGLTKDDYYHMGPYAPTGNYFQGTDWWNIVKKVYEE